MTSTNDFLVFILLSSGFVFEVGVSSNPKYDIIPNMVCHVTCDSQKPSMFPE